MNETDHVFEFIQKLTQLSKEYGIVLDVCEECIMLDLILDSDGLFETYNLDGTHVYAHYVEMAKTV